MKARISDLAPLSNERIFAESDYTMALAKAQTLFAQAYETGNSVVKQHARLRMAQMDELCQQELQAHKKYGKRQAV